MVASKVHDPTASGAGGLELGSPSGALARASAIAASLPTSTPARQAKMRLDALTDDVRELREEMESLRIQARAGEERARDDKDEMMGLMNKLDEKIVVQGDAMTKLKQTIEAGIADSHARFDFLLGRVEELFRHMAKEEKKSASMRKMQEGGSQGEGNDDDGLTSVELSPVAASRLGLVFFTGKEIEARVCDMSRQDVDEKVPELREDLEQRHSRIQELLNCEESVYRARIVESGEEGELDREADAFIRRAARACISVQGDNARIFRDDERELRREDATESRLGRMLLERMEAFGTLTSLDDIRAHKKYMSEEVYLSVGMSKVRAKAAAGQLRADFNLLPAKERGAIDLSRMLISKIPKELTGDATRTFAERLEDEMSEVEAQGGKTRTYRQLTDVIAIRLSRDTNNGPAASETESSESGDDEEQGEARPQVAAAATFMDSSFEERPLVYVVMARQ
jgi:hypothetical protein